MSNVSKHARACKGPIKRKIRGVDFDPNVGFHNGTRKAWNLGLTKETSKSLIKSSETLKAGFESGRLSPKGFYSWTKEQCSSHAKKSGFGGYREGAGRSKKFFVKDSFGKDVCLQSSYEKLTADLLDQLGIRWIRPTFLRYDDRKYFPDFYLVDLDFYLDPKNDFLAKKDEEKIDRVMDQNKVKILILSKDDITINKFSSWIS